MTYRRRDSHHQRARDAGYRARSAWKLLELDRRFRLLRPGDRVADLGAWPGGWLQVALERVGPAGTVVGVDVTPIDPLPAPNLTLIAGDVRDPATIARVRTALGAPADVVLVDLAPKLSGVRATDEARTAELVAASLGALPTLLRPGGALVLKLFVGSDYAATRKTLRRAFAHVHTTRPDATRRTSAEVYAIGLDRGGDPG